MKKLHYLLVVLSIFVLACESDDDAGSSITISAEFEIDKTFEVVIDEDKPRSINETVLFEASDDDLDVLDQVDGYEITSLQIIIANYAGPNDIELSNMSLAVVGTTTAFTLETFQLQNGTIDITDDADIFEAIAAEFLADNDITLTITGDISGEERVSFDMTIEVGVKASGSPS